MSALEGDKEKVKERKRLNISNSEKLLIMFPVLLAQIKVWNNSYKLKPGTTVIVLYQHNKIATI